VETKDGSSKGYDAVVLAAPLHQTGIEIRSDALSDDAEIAKRVPPQPYVHLHVTLLSTTAPQPNPAYFGLPNDAKVPTTILTSYEGVRTSEGHKAPEFNSLQYHGLVREPMEGEAPEYRVKIFSLGPLSDAWLDKLFDGKIGWVLRKEVS
jgi:prenylcysteine oxidase / farnesylcysteine lyase